MFLICFESTRHAEYKCSSNFLKRTDFDDMVDFLWYLLMSPVQISAASFGDQSVRMKTDDDLGSLKRSSTNG